MFFLFEKVQYVSAGSELLQFLTSYFFFGALEMVFESKATLQMNSVMSTILFLVKWRIYGTINRVCLLLLQADVFIF